MSARCCRAAVAGLAGFQPAPFHRSGCVEKRAVVIGACVARRYICRLMSSTTSLPQGSSRHGCRAGSFGMGAPPRPAAALPPASRRHTARFAQITNPFFHNRPALLRPATVSAALPPDPLRLAAGGGSRGNPAGAAWPAQRRRTRSFPFGTDFPPRTQAPGFLPPTGRFPSRAARRSNPATSASGRHILL